MSLDPDLDQDPLREVLYAEIAKLHDQAIKIRGENLDLRRALARAHQARVAAEKERDRLRFQLETT
jgi:hypothetical protein